MVVFLLLKLVSKFMQLNTRDFFHLFIKQNSMLKKIATCET